MYYYYVQRSVSCFLLLDEFCCGYYLSNALFFLFLRVKYSIKKVKILPLGIVSSLLSLYSTAIIIFKHAQNLLSRLQH